MSNLDIERQVIESCLFCVLPDCIPDHLLCPMPGPKRPAPRPWSIPMCAWCANGTRVVPDDPHQDSFFRCRSTGDNTTGYRQTCRWFKDGDGSTAYARRKATGAGSGATRYHEVHQVQ